MRLIKLVFKIVLILVVLVAIGGYLFIRNFDLNKYKPMIAELTEKQLGRKLVINGDAELGISFVPMRSLSVRVFPENLVAFVIMYRVKKLIYFALISPERTLSSSGKFLQRYEKLCDRAKAKGIFYLPTQETCRIYKREAYVICLPPHTFYNFPPNYIPSPMVNLFTFWIFAGADSVCTSVSTEVAVAFTA